MIISSHRNSSKRKNSKLIFILECDFCHCVYETRLSQNAREREVHYCSCRCAAKSDKTKDKKKKTSLERYGTEWASQSPKFQEQSRLSSIEKYGAVNVMQSTYGKEKFKNTMLQRYGAEHLYHVEAIRDKIHANNRMKFGVDMPFQSTEIQKKVKETNVEKYGVEHQMQREEIKEKLKNTFLAKYGVCNPLMSGVLNKNKNSFNAVQKCHTTKKKNGSYGKSRAEDDFYSFLCDSFNKEIVERQVCVNGWAIDFRIKNVYIQFDGVYWHGLDRDVEKLKAGNTSQDKVIFRAYQRDIKQNQWFKDSNLILIRITDKQFCSNDEYFHSSILNIVQFNSSVSI